MIRSKLRHTLPGLVLTAILILGTNSYARAQTILSTEHVDLTFNYVSGWLSDAQDKTNGVRYAPSDVVLQVNSNAQQSRPPDSQWDFLGADTVWILPFVQDTSLLYLGTNVEGTATGTFDSYDATSESGGRVTGTAPWVKVTLISVSGPGDFSVWTNGAFGVPTVWMSTFNGIDSSSAFWIFEGSHIHFNWAFTASGDYDVTFQASGYIGGTLSVSDPVTYHFTVQP